MFVCARAGGWEERPWSQVRAGRRREKKVLRSQYGRGAACCKHCRWWNSLKPPSKNDALCPADLRECTCNGWGQNVGISKPSNLLFFGVQSGSPKLHENWMYNDWARKWEQLATCDTHKNCPFSNATKRGTKLWRVVFRLCQLFARRDLLRR